MTPESFKKGIILTSQYLKLLVGVPEFLLVRSTHRLKLAQGRLCIITKFQLEVINSRLNTRHCISHILLLSKGILRN